MTYRMLRVKCSICEQWLDITEDHTLPIHFTLIQLVTTNTVCPNSEKDVDELSTPFTFEAEMVIRE